MKVKMARVEPMTSRSQVRCPNNYCIMPHFGSVTAHPQCSLFQDLCAATVGTVGACPMLATG